MEPDLKKIKVSEMIVEATRTTDAPLLISECTELCGDIYETYHTNGKLNLQ